jgi:hypothetical protein
MSEAIERVSAFLASGQTGSLTLNVDRGIITSIEVREKLRTDGKHDTVKVLDRLVRAS